MIVVNILFAILIFVRFVTGVRLFFTGRGNHLPNFLWLSGSMFVTVIVLSFAPLPGNPLAALPSSLWIFTVGSLAGEASLIVFNQLTFYKDRKSPIVWVWIIFAVSAMLSMYGVFISESNYDQSPWAGAHIFAAVLIWAWHGGLAYQALSRLAAERTVQDWVKTRYQLIVVYSVVLIIGSFASIIRTFFADGNLQSAVGSWTAVISLIVQIVSIVLMFLVWVMPERFRLWLNRHQQTRMDEQVYEQALTILDILGTAMTKDTRFSKMLVVVALRKTIGQEINTEDSKKIEAHMVTMGYDAWAELLNNPELYIYIKNVASVNPRAVLANAKRALVENQSLFTVQAR